MIFSIFFKKIVTLTFCYLMDHGYTDLLHYRAKNSAEFIFQTGHVLTKNFKEFFADICRRM